MDVQTTTLDEFMINRAVETGEVRLPVHEEAAVAWALEGPGRQRYDVRTADLSKAGLVLLVDQSLPMGAWAKVNLRCGIVFGRVRRVAPQRDGGFRVCIRVDELLPR